jgi:hypothetical protein
LKKYILILLIHLFEKYENVYMTCSIYLITIHNFILPLLSHGKRARFMSRLFKEKKIVVVVLYIVLYLPSSAINLIMFPGFISLCMYPAERKYRMPSAEKKTTTQTHLPVVQNVQNG